MSGETRLVSYREVREAEIAREQSDAVRLWSTLASQLHYGIPHRSPDVLARINKNLARRDTLLEMTTLARSIAVLPYKETVLLTPDGYLLGSEVQNPDWTEETEAKRRPLADKYWKRYFDLVVDSMNDELVPFDRHPSPHEIVGGMASLVSVATKQILGAENPGQLHGWLSLPSFADQLQRTIVRGTTGDPRKDFLSEMKSWYPHFGSEFAFHPNLIGEVEMSLGNGIRVPQLASVV